MRVNAYALISHAYPSRLIVAYADLKNGRPNYSKRGVHVADAYWIALIRRLIWIFVGPDVDPTGKK